MNSITRGIVLAGLALGCSNTPAHAASAGMTGHSGKDPKYDCSACHDGGVSDPQVTVTGPVTVDIDSTITYTISVHGAPGNVGGFNVAASAGTLGIADDDARIVDRELTQRASRVADDAGTVHFRFRWRAPDTPGTYTLFVAGVLGNANGQPTGDSALQTDLKINVIDRSAAANEAPLAHLQVPRAALVGEKVMLNAVQSKDVDGNIVSYEWNFGDGEIQTGQRAAVLHEYSTPGVYTPELTVTDSDGSTGSALAQIEIKAPDQSDKKNRPKAVSGGPYDVAFGEPVQFDGSESRPSHKEGQIVAYEWDFGDGYQGSGVTVSHYYALPARYVATLTVWDDRGLPSTAKALVQVRQGERPRLRGFLVPDKVLLKDDQPQPHILSMAVDIAGLGEGESRCGVVYLQRNKQPYEHQTVCLVGSKHQRIIFNYVFTQNDTPSVTWTAYMVLEPTLESQRQTKTTSVKISDSEQSKALKS
jgi:chitodextrinase